MGTRPTSDQSNSALGAFIRDSRLAKGWTLDEAEMASDVERTYWSKVERGVLRKPDARYLARMAAALDLPLADVYGLAGYTAPSELPGLSTYLRSKYHLPPEAIRQLEGYFAFLRHQYGIPPSQPVFPPRRRGRRPGSPPKPRPTDGPWSDPAVGQDSPRRAA